MSAALAEHRARAAIHSVKLTEAPMPDQPIDPAATPEDPTAPMIAADDAGATAMAETFARKAANDDHEGESGEGV